MSEIKFQGTLKGINEKQLEFIRSVLKNRGYKDETVQVADVGKVEDNSVANVKRFVVEKNGKTFTFFGKIAPYIEVMRKRINAKEMFFNEHMMYTEILPKYSELEVAAGIPEKDRLRYAVCYGSHSEEPNEVILLEDLQLSGFTILDKTESLNNETVRLILKNVAKLHSYSFVLKNQHPENFEYYKSKVSDRSTEMHDNPDFIAYMEQLENEIIQILKNDQHKELVKGSLVNLRRSNAKNLKANDQKYTVIIHGDTWTNNIMFQLENDLPFKCCLIDFQISCVHSPALDLEYLIFNCTDYETRSKNFHQWIDCYHQELENSLLKFGLKAKKVYPREQLDADLKRYGQLCLGMALVVTTMMMRESAQAGNLKEAMEKHGKDGMLETSKLENMAMTGLDRLLKRVDGVIKSLLELGYLNENKIIVKNVTPVSSRNGANSVSACFCCK